MSSRLTRLIQRTARPVARQVALSTGGGSSGPIAIADVTGLTTALEGKANDSHTHLAGEISDLDDVLNEYVTAAGLSESVDDRVAALLVAGANVTLVFADALTVTDGSNLRLNGNFTTSADDTLTLVCDGTNWYEVARSAN
jgi:hypothetical protein